MPGLNIRDVPEETIRALKRRARAHHRSVQGEIRAILMEHGLSRIVTEDQLGFAPFQAIEPIPLSSL